MFLKNNEKYLFLAITLSFISATLLHADINGTIFRDYNLNGIKDALEVGVAEINVTAYSDDGVVSQTVTDSIGEYCLSIDEGKYRVEISGIPEYLQVGTAVDGQTKALSSMVSNGAIHNIGLNNPADYSQKKPNIIVTRMVKGAYLGVNKDKNVLLQYSYLNSNDTDIPTPVATLGQLGSVYGVAYLKRANITYVSSYFKRHTGIGIAGVGAIYKVDNSLNSSSTFATLSGIDPRHADVSYDWNYDTQGYADVGKVGVGDIELSDDETMLFAVNMYDRKLYLYGLNLAGESASTQSHSIPNPCSSEIDFRPMGLGFNDGILYVGVTCTAESTVKADDANDSTNGARRGDSTKLSAHIYSFNPLTAIFSSSPILDIDLSYGRGCIYTSDVNDINSTNSCTYVDKDGITQPYLANWNPWQMDYDIVFNDKKPGNIGNQDTWIEYPQPILSDITFDNDDSMIISIRDINGDRTGYDNFSPNIEDNSTHNGNGEGDILRACGNLKEGWILESNGSCGGVTTGGANNNEGLGGGEYYWYDNGLGGHGSVDESLAQGYAESVMGGILQIAGYPSFVASAMDVHGLKDNGLIWLENRTGEIAKDSLNRVKRLKVSDDNSNVTFGKASGMGGIELLSAPSPIEIGDYVWEDSNSNGIQEPSELPIEGVEVQLYSGATLIGKSTTNSEGHYYFGGVNSSNMLNSSSIQPYSNYILKIDLSASGLGDRVPTALNVGENRLIDSDGSATIEEGFSTILYSTSRAGFNDHSLDFGFTDVVSNIVVPISGVERHVSEESSPNEIQDDNVTLKASIGNFVWWDSNINGIQDSNESGVPNVKVRLLQMCESESIKEIATQYTDENGTYYFGNLNAGVYCLEFTELPDLVNITLQDNGGESMDSDVLVSTGRTPSTELQAGEDDDSWDMGIYYPSWSLATSSPLPSSSIVPIGGGGESDMVGEEFDSTVESPTPMPTVIPPSTPSSNPSSSSTPPIALPTVMVSELPTSSNVEEIPFESNRSTPDIMSSSLEGVADITSEGNHSDESVTGSTQTICEVSEVRDRRLPANREGATTVIDIFSNNIIALDTQNISLVKIEEGQALYQDGKAISTTNLIKSQTLKVEGEGVWEVNDGAIHFTAQDGFNGIPSPIHYVIEQNQNCTNILGMQNNISEIGEIRLITPCVCETYETVVSESIPFSNISLALLLVFMSFLSFFLFKNEEFKGS